MNGLEWILFFLPAGLANMSPILASLIPGLNRWSTPLDFGRKYKNKPIFGSNKTWRGVIFGSIIGALSAALIDVYEPGVYSTNPLITGALLGFGALLGDAVESFFKRQRGIKPGYSWFPFDQTDYIIGGLLAVWTIASLSLSGIVIIFLTYFGLHLLFSYIGFLLGVKSKPI